MFNDDRTYDNILIFSIVCKLYLTWRSINQSMDIHVVVSCGYYKREPQTGWAKP